MGQLNDEDMNLTWLAEQVIELSSSYDTLSDASKNLLKIYSDELIGIMPELADSIDEVTGAYKGNKEELTALIAAEEAHIKAQALEQNLTDIAKRKYALQPKYDQLSKDAADAGDAYREASQALQDYGFELSDIMKMQKGDFYKGGVNMLWNVKDEKILNYAKNLKQLYANSRAATDALSTISDL